MNKIFTTDKFDSWFHNLRDIQAKRRIQARIDRAESGHFGDCKPVGEGVSEMRLGQAIGFILFNKVWVFKLLFC